jgi:hypothetical protein
MGHLPSPHADAIRRHGSKPAIDPLPPYCVANEAFLHFPSSIDLPSRNADAGLFHTNCARSLHVLALPVREESCVLLNSAPSSAVLPFLSETCLCLRRGVLTYQVAEIPPSRRFFSTHVRHMSGRAHGESIAYALVSPAQPSMAALTGH